MQNLAYHLAQHAHHTPFKMACVVACGQDAHSKMPVYAHITFAQLWEKSLHYANSFEQLGITKGTKTLLFIRPDLDFPAVIFALLKIGAVPTFIDPGMGRKNLLNCIAQVQPAALIGVPKVHVVALLYPQIFKSVKVAITTVSPGKIKWAPFWRMKLSALEKNSLSSLSIIEKENLENSFCQLTENDPQAILFTSGGTGTPKGVVVTQKIFTRQRELLQQMFSLGPQDVDLPGLPIFCIFTISMGMTSCLPDMDPTRPAQADPRKLIRMMQDFGVTFCAGSPAIWERVASYACHHKILLPSLRTVAMFGAPVDQRILRDFQQILPAGDTYTPYGATESLPLTNMAGSEILELARSQQGTIGQGVCVGKAVPGLEIKVIAYTEDAITSIEQAQFLKNNEVGEIIVRGDVVTREYYQMPTATTLSKIRDGHTNTWWHRMGDMGYLDEEGKLWFFGRKSHVLHTEQGMQHSVPCEEVFNSHPQVRRSALVGRGAKGRQRPTIVIELKNKKQIKSPAQLRKVRQEILLLAQDHPQTRNIRQVFFHKQFPLDIRHNIKIQREVLKVWVEKRKDDLRV